MKKFLGSFLVTILVVVGAYLLRDGVPQAGRNFDRLLAALPGRDSTTATEQIAAPATPAPVPVATPTPVSIPTPEPKVVAVATPTPTPIPVATPDPNSPALIWQSLAASQEEWPRQVRLRKPAQFPVVVNGAGAGSVLVPAGAVVDVVSIKADTVAVTFQKAGRELAALDTDLVEAVRENRRRGIVPRLKPVLAAAPAAVSAATPRPAFTCFASALQKPAPAKPFTQELLLPARIGSVPAGNDFNDPNSEFCYQRSKSTDHFQLFWAKEYGDDPMANSVAGRRFDVDEVLKEADRSYDYFLDTLKWVDRDKSFATKYKFLFFVVGGSDGTAYGGSVDNKIGAFWTPASRINRGPYGVIAHELGHSFQSMSRADGAASFSGGGAISEMTSQFMLWQVYPEWQTFENYHLKAFMQATHLAFLHPDNQYHTCYPLEYWSWKHGVDFIGKMWREVQRGEDPVMTYQRLTKINQDQFNDEMFDACRRFITWDLPRIEKVAARYSDQHFTSITRAADNWYQIAADKCPQNYGYNAIKLKIPAEGTRLKLAFKGLAGAEGFSQTHLDKAGWRYGFLAHLEDGSRAYSTTGSAADGRTEFAVPPKTKTLWLVVMGAPTEHWTSERRRRRATDADVAESTPGEQWPYKFNLTGTVPDNSIIH